MPQFGEAPSGLRAIEATRLVKVVVTVLLSMHLLALGVAVSSNAGPVSVIRMQLRRITGIRPYLQLLHMDLAYNYHLTYALETDTDHFIEMDSARSAAGAASDAGPTAGLFPAPGIRPRIRAERYRNLMRAMVPLLDDDERESLLPRAVARRLLAVRGVDSGIHQLRLQRLYLVSREDAASADPAQRDPYAASLYETVYEAAMKFDGGQLIAIKTADRAQTAPRVPGN